MMRRPKSEERALWRDAMRGVKPLQRDRVAAASVAPRDEAASAPPVPRERSRTNPRGAAKAAPSKAPELELDRRNAQRLKRGQVAIDARLDLHGMTQDEAHRALDRFIARAAAAQQRNLLIITGKSGVLHGTVPRWLEHSPNRAHLLAFTRAPVSLGGAGALYVRLRRQR